MSKKILLTVFITLFVLAGGAWYYYLRHSPSSPLAQTLGNILPFGSGGDNVPGTSSGNANPDGTAGTFNPNTSTHLFKLTDTPIAGAIAFQRGGELVVRYAERATGHIYEIKPVSLEKTQILNQTQPKIYNAIWKKDGSAVIYQTLQNDTDTILSTSISLIPPSGTSTSDLYSVKTSALPVNTNELTVGLNTIAYTQKASRSVTQATFDGAKPSVLFVGAFNQWLLALAGDNTLVLTTKPSSNTPGYSYAIDAKTKTLRKILGPLNGLSVLPNQNFSRIAYSSSESNFSFTAKNLSTGTESRLFPATLADKCVWSLKKPADLYCGAPSDVGAGEPDQWYQGIVHFADRLWRFDTSSDISDIIADPQKDFGVAIDAEKLFLSPDEDYLFFTNRNDLSLWALKLE